jgi:hypothetical protein
LIKVDAMDKLDLLFEPPVEGVIGLSQRLEGAGRIITFQVDNAQITLGSVLEVPGLTGKTKAPVEVLIVCAARALHFLGDTPGHVRPTRQAGRRECQ